MNSIIDVARRNHPLLTTADYEAAERSNQQLADDEEEGKVPSSADWQQGLNFVTEKLEEK